jgi:hypothetical protein
MSTTFDHRALQRHAFGIADANALQDLPEGITGTPLVPQELDGSAHLMPVLLDFRTMPANQADTLLEHLYDCQVNGVPPPVGLLIQTDDDAGTFVHRWNALQIATPGPGNKVWLRVHDSRVLHQLLRILTPAQTRRVFGRAEAFTYWVGGGWVTVHPPAPDDAEGSVAPVQSSLGRWDWQRVELIGAINRALQRAGINGADALLAKGALAEQLMERATVSYGLTSREDKVEFAARGLITNTKFDQHPQIAAAIIGGKDADGDATLADRLALIDEQVWEEIRQPGYQKQGGI